MSKKMRMGLMVILSVVFLVSITLLMQSLYEYRKAENIYKDSQQLVFHIEEDSEEEMVLPTIDFDTLLATNSQIIGWIWIPDTEINYPLLQGDNNNQYLTLTYNKVKNNSGSIFLDYRNSKLLDDDNSIIYGHNMKNGAMFSGLEKFAEQTYFEQHPYVYIFTPQGNYRYALFSAYKTDEESDTYAFRFGAERVVKYIQQSKDQSVVSTDILPDGTQPMIVLSTCTNRVQTERFVVHAVLEEAWDVVAQEEIVEEVVQEAPKEQS